MYVEVTSVEPMGTTPRAAALDVTTVHERHVDFVWKNLQRLGVRTPDLEDALQDVFVVVHRRLDSFNGSSLLTTWLFGICLRVALAYRRRSHVRRERSSIEFEPELATDSEQGPEALTIARQTRLQLERVLDSLEPQRRAVFTMFELEDMSAPVIARTLGIPLGTVYSRLSAARVDFKKALERLRKRDDWRSPP
jgi:RNA polymerase sigma-70 factor (ECF subfamily)